jgi:proteasome assembly chaperone (PAC2) family protein
MYEQRGPIGLDATPKLVDPYLFAAWSGMGAVALLAANYLRQALHAIPFGEIDPYGYYAPTQVLVKDGLIQVPEFPETRFYYWISGGEHDLLLLIGTEQPPDVYDIAIQVADAAKRLGVERVYTAAAFPTLIHHGKVPAVWGTATHSDLLSEIKAYGANVMEHGTISGLNGLLLAVAKERGIDGICLLGEIPAYARGMINPRASHAVLAILTRMFGIEADLSQLVAWADDLRSEMDKLYSTLPNGIRETFERGQAIVPHPTANLPEAEPPLVADDAFFDQIEQFLEEHRRSEDDPDLEQDQDAAE